MTLHSPIEANGFVETHFEEILFQVRNVCNPAMYRNPAARIPRILLSKSLV